MYLSMNQRKSIAFGVAVLVWLASASPQARGQGTPEGDGLRFNRFAGKTLETLARKAGGPTERIEIQSTEDHIDYVVKAYNLEKANANEVYQYIVNAVELEGGHVDRFAPNSVIGYDRDSGAVTVEYSGPSMLVITAPEWMIPYLDDTIKVLDIEDLKTAEYGSGLFYIRPKHRKPSELMDLIGGVVSGLQIFVADDSRNVLYLEDLPSWYPYVIQGLNAFDVPPYQIDTRVRIYEIEESDSLDVGLDWYAWKKSIAGGDLTAEWSSPSGAPPDASHLNLQSVTADLSFNPLLATEFLNYLVGKGSAEVVTDSRISLVNGKEGAVGSTSVIPFILREAGEDGAVLNVVNEYMEGVSVTIMPSIGTESMELEVQASVASHIGYTPNQQIPIITDSSLDTSIVLESGKPAVLGGLSRERMVNERSGVPWLKDVPCIKYLFSRKIERTKRSQIIITILPSRFEPGAAQPVTPALAMPSAP